MSWLEFPQSDTNIYKINNTTSNHGDFFIFSQIHISTIKIDYIIPTYPQPTFLFKNFSNSSIINNSSVYSSLLCLCGYFRDFK